MNLAVSPVAAQALHEGAGQKLRRLAEGRDILRAAFRETWAVLERKEDADALDDWAAACLDLMNVNAGPRCLLAFWQESVRRPAGTPLDLATEIGHGAADVCRRAGARAATAAVGALAPVAQALGTQGVSSWRRALTQLAGAGAEPVLALCEHVGTVLASLDGASLEGFVAAGLKAGAKDRARLLAFFSLRDPMARTLLARGSGSLSFTDVEPVLKAYAAALWGQSPVLRAVQATEDRAAPRRTSIVAGMVRVPDVFRGVPKEQSRALFMAATAHATAHLALAPVRFPVGQLKPLQIALVSLIEDARVEALALETLPGLRSLWTPLHVARPSNAVTAPALLARLTRALFDPDFEDPHGFIRKGRELFAAARPRLHDPSISREIGGLLGNDLGQMRVQFNAKDYVVEPVYRDDGTWMWDFPDDAHASPQEIEMQVDAVRVEQTEDLDRSDRQKQDGASEPEDTGRARGVPPDDRGVAVATYPEWDRAAGIERPDWTTVREVAPKPASSFGLDRTLDAEPALRGRVARLVRAARIGRPTRLRRQPEGLDLDLDAALEAAIALRAGEVPDARVYRASTRKDRDLAVTVLVDVSESTRDRVPGTVSSVLDVERVAVALLGQALEELGDRFSLLAFASNGREEVRLTRIKAFSESFGGDTCARLAGLEPGLSTRLGAALRHAGRELAAVRSHRKLLLVLTDGEPSDVDVADPLDLIEDARRAALGLKLQGVDVFGLTLDPAGHGSGDAVFGRANHIPIRRLADLPARLASLYFRLARH